MNRTRYFQNTPACPHAGMKTVIMLSKTLSHASKKICRHEYIEEAFFYEGNQFLMPAC